MAVDSVLQPVLDAITPPGDWIAATQTKSVYGPLVGCAASLIHSRPMIDRYLSDLNAGTAPSTWDRTTIYQDILTASHSSEGVLWEQSQNMRAWSIGFFLNKAAENIAASFDKCINAWLRWWLYDNPTEIGTEDLWIGVYPLSRLLVLKKIAPDSTQLIIDQFCSGVEQYYDSRQFNPILEELCHRCQDSDLISIIGHESIIGLPEEHCVAMVCGRVNDFKHRAKSILKREGVCNAVEWAIAARALCGVGRLWRDHLVLAIREEHEE